MKIQKTIQGMLDIVRGEITEYVKQNRIDVIVNAASPTLMGSDSESVDKSIHDKINKKLKLNMKFKDKIREQLDGETKEPEEKIRCARGQAVVTKGYGLCKYVIHVVGPHCDGPQKWKERSWCCTSSCTKILENCYKNVMSVLKENRNVETVAIPIIGAGNYGIPFELAVRIAIATVGNSLAEWETEDEEYFQRMSLKKLTFCIYDKDRRIEHDRVAYAQKVLKDYNSAFAKEHRVVYQKSWEAQTRYIYDLVKNDKKRGYFAIAHVFRLVLLVVRLIFMPVLWLKDKIGGSDWNRRRETVEIITFLKFLFPFLVYFLITKGIILGKNNIGYKGIIIYMMADTITYLVCLIVLSDVQRPSANVIRSIILLLINYLEVTLDFAVLYYLYADCKVEFGAMIAYSVLDKTVEGPDMSNSITIILDYAKSGIQFFFMTMAFGYFANHLHQRKFMS